MSTTTLDLQTAVQAASDGLAAELVAGGCSTNARKALQEARAALKRHQDAKHATERERKATEAAEDHLAAALAVDKATSTVTAFIDRVQLPEGVAAPVQTAHPTVAAAAAEKARLEMEIQRGKPALQSATDEVAALTARADTKRAEARAIRSRRLAGHEKADDAAWLHLFEADATDLEGLVQAAKQRLQNLKQPVAELRKRLNDADARLKLAGVEAELHGQAERVRVLEQALVAALREMRCKMTQLNRFNLASYFAPTQGLRDVANGITPR